MSKSPRHAPRDLTPSWPDSPSTDVAGEVARQVALRVKQAIRDRRVRSERKAADLAGVDEGTLRNILSGDRWPDLRTLALLEHALQALLWPVCDSSGGSE